MVRGAGWLVAAALVAGCATKENTEDKPSMRAMGQEAKTEEDGSDESVGAEVRRRLGIADANATASVIVEVSEGVVTLRGSAATLQDAWRAEAAARGRAVPTPTRASVRARTRVRGTRWTRPG